MGNGMVDALAMLVEHDIREVVVLVDDEVKLEIVGFCSIEYDLQLVGILCLCFYFLNLLFAVIFSILLYKAVQFNRYIGIEPLLQHVNLAGNLREIKKEHLVFSMQWGSVTANPQAAEQGLETVLLIAVVVGVEHAKEYALSEATRTDEEQVVWLFL